MSLDSLTLTRRSLLASAAAIGATSLLPAAVRAATDPGVIRPFRVNVPEEVLVDLRRRLVCGLGYRRLAQPLLLEHGLCVAQTDGCRSDAGSGQTRLGAALAVTHQHDRDCGDREIALAPRELLDAVAGSTRHANGENWYVCNRSYR